MKKEDIKYIDCHTHPHDIKYINEGINVKKVLEDLKQDGGVTIAIGTDFELSKQALQVAIENDNCFASIGVHPADNHADVFDERFEKLYLENKNKIVAVGECGLDYYYFEKIKKEKPEFDIEKEVIRQKKIFIDQIEFAIKYNLPLVLHGRPTKNSMDAYSDILDILESYPSTSSGPAASLRGHAHFFVGNLEIAKRFLNLGFLMSFDGPITFSNEYDEVIKFLPMENIMIETDSPYAAPAPYRGQINYPIYVKEVAKKIAELKNLSVEEVLEITKNNAIKLFSLYQK